MTAPGPATSPWMRLAPAAALVLLFAVGVGGGFTRALDWSELQLHHADLQAWVDSHRLLAPLVFVIVVIAAVGSGLPVGLMLTVTGGSLFGGWLGAALTTVAASLGGTVTFISAKLAGHDALLRRLERSGGRAFRLVHEFRRNAFVNIVTLRFIPFFPFAPVNIAAGLAGMSARTFLLASLVGEIPSALIFANLGAGLGRALRAGRAPTFEVTLQILTPLLGLAVMAVVASVLRWRLSRTSSPVARSGPDISP